VYLGDDEGNPERTIRNKNFIEKIMFLAAVARPRVLEDGTYWDGKIGLYPFVTRGVQLRTTPVRARGEETIIPTNVDREVFYEYLSTHLLPDIYGKCPAEMINQIIYIQLDNATPHSVDSELFNRDSINWGLDCRLLYQPAQSPDFNICDLSFFPAIQSLFYKQEHITTKNRLIEVVLESFVLFDANKLNRAFLSLFQNYNMVLEHHGGNNYKVPHMRKEMLERMGQLPELVCVIIPPLDDNLPFNNLIPCQLDDGGIQNWTLEDNVDDNCLDLYFDEEEDPMLLNMG
jgi:hypothetical protein